MTAPALLARELLVWGDMLPKAPRSRRLPRRLLVIGAGLAAALPAAAFAQAPAEPSAVEDLVRAAAAAHLPTPGPNQRLEVGPIRGPAPPADCAGRMHADPAPGIAAPARVLIELRCDGPTHWHLFVPVRVVGTTPVVMTRHAIVPGSLLTAADLSLEQRDAVGLPPGYLNDTSIAVGMTASRAIAGGAVLTNQQLAGPKTVQRGQMVTLVANASGISVRMPGKALSDGFINQRIRVENLSSGKIVEGVARSDQVVEIVLQ
jgi:flagella basal body P-ring formation protein FlgA